MYQVEYAMEAISHAGTCLGVLADDGILIAAEKRNVHKLLDDSVIAEKIYRISDNMACTVAGITADANILISRLRYWAADYKHSYGESIPCEQLVQSLCNEKQRYTQIGGRQPSQRRRALLSCGGVVLVAARRATACCRQAALRRQPALRRLGSALRLPAVPVRPQRQLHRLEGDLHRQ